MDRGGIENVGNGRGEVWPTWEKPLDTESVDVSARCAPRTNDGVHMRCVENIRHPRL